MYDPNAYERVMNRAPAEIAHLAGGVADRINDPATDLMIVGGEISWLSQVLPDVAAGSLNSFRTTGTWWRQMAQQQIQQTFALLQMYCATDAEFCEKIKDELVPQWGKMMDEYTFGMVYALAMMPG
jgi:hypothetical protein